MLIHEVIQATGLTKKAIEYYTEKGLISPAILENGYRNFSQNDVEQLNKIFVLRKLGISTKDIKTVLSDPSKKTLQILSVQKELNLQRELAKKSILEKLSRGQSYCEIRPELQAIDNSKTITEKLLEAFPGFYGKFICLHFARFLNEPIKTNRQQTAFKKIISFLDHAPALTLPEDLQEYLIESTESIETEQITLIIEDMNKSIENPDAFLSNNQEILKQYIAYKQSDEYQNSPTYKIMTQIRVFNSTSGYYDVFIPALKELSHSYAKYYKQLETANKKLLAQYPEIEKI